MAERGQWLGLAALTLALLASCGQTDAPPADRATDTSAAVVSTAPSPDASPALSPPSAPSTPLASPAPPSLAIPVAGIGGAPAGAAGAPDAAPGPAPAPSRAPVASYPPTDECARQPGFAAFRDKVFAAARGKDADALVALADPAINLDFGGGSGREELRRRLAEPRTQLWSAIGRLAELGCAIDGGLATMPWIFSRLPAGFDDASTAMYGLGGELVLRERPAPDARAVRSLAWPVVALAGDGLQPGERFAEVVLSDGTRGFLPTAQLRSLLDYRLIADGRGEGWRITALTAGD